ncbi:MAG: hypothetical protein ACI9GZ_004310, partial [Bacteroidia bacterium]
DSQVQSPPQLPIENRIGAFTPQLNRVFPEKKGVFPCGWGVRDCGYWGSEFRSAEFGIMRNTQKCRRAAT